MPEFVFKLLIALESFILKLVAAVRGVTPGAALAVLAVLAGLHLLQQTISARNHISWLLL